jgi:hypothetical protein
MASAASCTASTRTPGASRPMTAISAGRNSSAPMSLMCTTKRRCECAASKVSASCSAMSSWRRAASTWRASWSALGVGFTPPVQRVNSGSRSASRSRVSAWLTAGWLRPSASAARLTLRAACTAEKTCSRLRSRSRIFMPCIVLIKAHGMDEWRQRP